MVGTPTAVRSVRLLGHHALEAHFSYLFEHLGTLLFDVLGEANRAARGDDPGQELLALLERQAAQVVAIDLEQIKDEVRRWMFDRGRPDVGPAREPGATRKATKVGAPVVPQNNHFPIEH